MVSNNCHKCIVNTPPSGAAFFIMIVYLDESGDLGWKFNAPFMNGGSSRYLTIAFIIVPNTNKDLPHRQVSKTYTKFNYQFGMEHKGNKLPKNVREYFINRVIKMMQSNPDVLMSAITVKKERVFDHIRRDGNILYNYLTKIGICDHIKSCNGNVDFIRDERTIKVSSGNSLIEYLQTELWFEKNSKAFLVDQPAKSHQNFNILFIDWIANTIWQYYELGEDVGFSLLDPIMKCQKLFF